MRTGSSDMGRRRTDTPEGGGDLGGDLRQGGPVGQALGAVEVGGEVAVAEAEPGLASEAVEAVHHPPGLPGEAPAALVVVQPRQGVGHGVEVGADVQAVELGVVAGVDHGRDLGGRDDAHEAAQQAGGTYSSGEGGDHGARLMVRAPSGSRLPVCKARPVPARARPRQRAPPGGRRRHAAARRREPGSVGSARGPSGRWPRPASSTWTPSP